MRFTGRAAASLSAVFAVAGDDLSAESCLLKEDGTCTGGVQTLTGDFCNDAFWSYFHNTKIPGKSTSDALAAWVSSCQPSQQKACREAAQEPWQLFDCARRGLLATQGPPDKRAALLLLRRAAGLAAEASWQSAPRVVDERVECRRPRSSRSSSELRHFDADLLAEVLEPGRRCDGGSCVEECGLVVLDGVLSATDVDALLQHAELIAQKLPAEEEKGRKVDIDLHLSAQHGTSEGHVLFLYTLERLRRLVALAAQVPNSWVHFASHFLSRVTPGIHSALQDYKSNEEHSTVNHSHTIHCDEASFAAFHHSAVLWLTSHAPEAGGDVEFFDADQRNWRQKVQPAMGRLALFTSGWENIHRVKPLRQGVRWSLPLFVSVRAPLNVSRLAKGCIRPSSSKQWQYCEDRLSQWLSAPEEDLL